MISNNTRLHSTGSGLQKDLTRVLQLQPKWDSSNSPDMQERGHLIRDSVPRALRALLSTIPELKSSGFQVEGRDGTGRKTRVPWTRLFLPTHSPSATEGWYAVYIFAFDGSAVYLSLNQGTTTFSKGTLVPKPRYGITQRTNRARTLLTNSSNDVNGLSTQIELKDKGSLGRGYELGNVYAIKYLHGNIPDDDILKRDLARVLNLLNELYNSESEQISRLKAEPYQTERSYWFVGAHWGEDGDQTERFIENGIWENGYKDRYLDEVKSIQPGDRIAIKSTYTRKKNLPFDNKGNTVSVMAIKAVGTVTKNLGDGRRLQVEWTEYTPPREWYFFTNLYTLWHVERGNWMTDALIDFTFDEKPQDYYRFQNDPFWQERFGDASKIDMGAETKAAPPYTINDILSDGCFIERESLETMLKRLQSKKNMILQGPPGTGKTWLAKRLAFALIGHCDESKVKAMQFHPNLSYEDFVRGWRPTSEGKLSLIDGPFLEMIKSALKNLSSPYVVVIEEINRGNPAQIFGEILTLLEADRRTPSEALELCYRRGDDERVFIPENLYVIGTMNIADRSLALVDFALRRRFAFVDLEPKLGKTWRDWVSVQCGIDLKILTEIEKRIRALNDEITVDASLGRQFCIGHSYVTPPRDTNIGDAYEWFKQVVDTEIGPLLEEYWFDSPDKARSARQRLIEGL